MLFPLFLLLPNFSFNFPPNKPIKRGGKEKKFGETFLVTN